MAQLGMGMLSEMRVPCKSISYVGEQTAISGHLTISVGLRGLSTHPDAAGMTPLLLAPRLLCAPHPVPGPRPLTLPPPCLSF